MKADNKPQLGHTSGLTLFIAVKTQSILINLLHGCFVHSTYREGLIRKQSNRITAIGSIFYTRRCCFRYIFPRVILLLFFSFLLFYGGVGVDVLNLGFGVGVFS